MSSVAHSVMARRPCMAQRASMLLVVVLLCAVLPSVAASSQGAAVDSAAPVKVELRLYELVGQLRLNGSALTTATGLPPIKVLLDAGQHQAFSRSDGSFVFHGVPTGIYSLTVACEHAIFNQLKLDVGSKTAGVIRALEYTRAGRVAAPYPLELLAQGTPRYTISKPGFSILALLKQPMGIMVIVMLFMIFAFPRMVGNMNPEEMAEMQAEMAKNNPDQLMKSLFGGGGKKDDDDDDD
eukprot:PLAT12301.1.p1 GENE.PLAT12301.1~~PLAT12301.1.p1  ORF type:complete len:238 (-),score=105.74 PLAT12301.1:103-816(-)